MNEELAHLVRCLLFDVLSILVVDLSLKSVQRWSSLRNMWAYQVVLLSLCGCSLFALHHVPGLVIAAICYLIYLLLTSTSSKVPAPSKRTASPPPPPPPATAQCRRLRHQFSSDSETEDPKDSTLRVSLQNVRRSNGGTDLSKSSLSNPWGSAGTAILRRQPLTGSGDSSEPSKAAPPAARPHEQLKTPFSMQSASPPYVSHLDSNRRSRSRYVPYWNHVYDTARNWLGQSAYDEPQFIGSAAGSMSPESLKFPANPSTLGSPSALSSLDTATPQQLGNQQLLANTGPVLRKSASHHPPGLPNSGRNLCFMNSVFQCLARCPGLCDAVVTSMHAAQQGENAAMYEFLEESVSLLQRCREPAAGRGPSVLNTTEFREKAFAMPGSMVAKPEKSTYTQAQHDSSEFLLWLLETWHLASTPSTPSSLQEQKLTADQLRLVLARIAEGKEPISTIIQELTALPAAALAGLQSQLQELLGQPMDSLAGVSSSLILLIAECEYLKLPWSPIDLCLASQLVAPRSCEQCKRMSVQTAPCRILTLPVPTASGAASPPPLPLDRALASLSEIEHLSGPNNMHCRCGSVDKGQSQELLRRAAPVLIVQLMRFEYVAKRGVARKVSSPVSFPLSGLSLDAVLFEAVYEISPSPSVYDLCAVCVHIGSTSASYGHYVAYCREASGCWFRFDDESVKPVSDMAAELQTPLLLSNSYLLFYAKRG